MADILDAIDELDDDFDEFDEGSDDVVSGELVDYDEFDDIDDLDNYEMNERQAKEVTEAIRATAEATFILLARAHQHKAYKALGYSTWADYVREEFDMSAQRSYQLLDLGKAVEMIEAAVPEGTVIKLSEAQAREIKRELPAITEQLKEETETLSPAEAAARAAELIEEKRAEIAEQKKADDKVAKEKAKASEEEELEAHQASLEAAADALLEADRPDSMTDIADDGLLEFDVEGEDGASLSPEDSMNIYNFFNILSSAEGLPEPDDFIKIIPEGRAAEISDQILRVTSWMNRFQTLWEMREGGEE